MKFLFTQDPFQNPNPPPVSSDFSPTFWGEEDINHDGIPIITFLGNRPTFVTLSNFNIRVNEKKCTMSWKRLTTDRNGWKYVLETVYVGTCHIWFFEFTLGSFGSLYKIFDVKIFKTLPFNRVFFRLTELYGKYGNHESIQTITFFSGDLPIF